MCHSPFTVIAGVFGLLELYDKSAVRLVESGELRYKSDHRYQLVDGVILVVTV